MPVRLVKRPWSPYWVIRGTIGGCRYEESTGTADKEVADQIRVKFEADRLKEKVHGKKAVMTFAHAVTSYLEHGGSDQYLKPVLDHFGTTHLGEIDQDAIDAAAKKLYPNVGPASLNRRVYTPTSAVLHHAAKRGWCDRPIIGRPKQPKGRVRWLEPAEADKLIAACSDHLRPLVTFLLYTGARAGEALYLDWANVDLEARHVQFLATKNGEARGVPLHARVVAALSALEHRDGMVFRRPDGQPYRARLDKRGEPISGQFKTAFQAACRRAGIKVCDYEGARPYQRHGDFTPHDCRHTWATWHYRANRDLGLLQKQGGWKSLTMVMRYAHANVAEGQHAIDNLPGGLVQSVPDRNPTHRNQEGRPGGDLGGVVPLKPKVA
jgi:integrase